MGVFSEKKSNSTTGGNQNLFSHFNNKTDDIIGNNKFKTRINPNTINWPNHCNHNYPNPNHSHNHNHNHNRQFSILRTIGKKQQIKQKCKQV